MLRVHGCRKKYHHEILGINSRLDALQAAVLGVKLRYLPQWMIERQQRAAHYRELFDRAGLSEELRIPGEPSGSSHVYNQFTIRSKQRDALREYLRRRGVPSEIYYPVPLHLQPMYRDLGYRAGDFPEAEQAAREVLCLPIYPELTDAQVDEVAEACKRSL
jgi:dTDP-4-amino-4,6-dideoxygalactose transaminase